MRRPVLIVRLVVLTAALCGATTAQTISDETLTATLGDLRGGRFTATGLELVVEALIERDGFISAGGWIAEAEGKLPARERRTATKRWRASLPDEPGDLAAEALSLADALRRVEASRSALEMLDAARLILDVWPDPAAERRCTRIAKKVEGRGDHRALWTEKLKEKRSDLRGRLTRARAMWFERGAREFTRYGCAAGYRRLRPLAGGHDGHTELIRKMRRDAVKLGLASELTRPAKLWALTHLDIHVWVDGEEVGVQKGELALAYDDPAEAPRPRVIEFPVWDRTRLALILDYSRKFGTVGEKSEGDASDHAVCWRLEVGGKEERGRWRTMTGKTWSDIDDARLRPTLHGVVQRGADVQQERNGRTSTQQVSFNHPEVEFIIPLMPIIQDFFDAEKVTGRWMTGYGATPLYVLDVPR